MNVGSCGNMKKWQNWRTARSRSWSITARKSKVKLLTLALLVSMLVHITALSQRKSELPSTHNRLNFDLLGDDLRRHQVARRALLQDGRIRPTPRGYPPPGENQQRIPQAPSFARHPP
ncbi:hypothetical protein KC19_6G091400 [Ceratodon purpureus]|uniref:Uncharacterized protein n=1 Tax=Ceratodon purpureus TaxID=3225 RepID=A0A8T0HER8_CERPU|nr:hypothetical protein KC19_6G091400 [Ceratodon purpureus]